MKTFLKTTFLWYLLEITEPKLIKICNLNVVSFANNYNGSKQKPRLQKKLEKLLIKFRNSDNRIYHKFILDVFLIVAESLIFIPC